MAHHPEKRYCPNCHYPLPAYGEYCSNCSQKYTDGRVTLKVLFSDFLESIFNVDSRIFRTIAALFIPGKLTNAYFRGQQRRYASPLRLFFILTIVQIAVLGYLTVDQLEKQLGQFTESQRRDAHLAVFMDELDTARIKVDSLFLGDTLVQRGIDSLIGYLDDTRNDSIDFGYLKVTDGGTHIETQSLSISKKDTYELTDDELLERYEVEGFFHDMQVRQGLKFIKNGGNLPQFVLGNLVWMIVLMMPALSLILKLLYIRRKRYFVEHLVFSFHYHAFAFLVTSVWLILTYLMEEGWIAKVIEPQWIFFFLFFWIMIYLWIAMRRVYRQGFFKTFTKYVLLNFSYLVIFTLFLLSTFAISALTF